MQQRITQPFPCAVRLRGYALALWLGLSSTVALAEPVNLATIIAQHVAARGNSAQALDQVILEQSGQMSFPGSTLKIAVHMWTGQGKQRSEATMQGLTQISSYDGVKGFKVEPFEGRKDAAALPPDEINIIKVDADLEWPFVHAEQKGNRLIWLGSEEIDGGLAYGIRVDLKDGNQRTYWLDADTFMVIREVSKNKLHGVDFESESDYSDYERVAGVYVPMAVSSGPKNASAAQKSTIQFTQATWQPAVAASLFSRVVGGGSP